MELTNIILIVAGALAFLFMAVGGTIAFFVYDKLRWNHKWMLIENGIIIKQGKSRLINFGDGGEEVFQLKGTKKWRVAYGKRVGKNMTAWEVGKDGYWYNVTFAKDFDNKLREVGVNPVDRDMRYATASVRKGIENRYNDKNFFDKWGVPITIGMLVIAIIIGGVTDFIIAKQQLKITASNVQGLETSKEVMEIAERVLDRVAIMDSGGSGIRPA